MPKWIVTTHFPDGLQTVENFEEDAPKNVAVEALRTRIGKGEVRYVDVEEPATQGKARLC